jgi:predicted DNA-binding protein (MmcQ/YjbR family)
MDQVNGYFFPKTCCMNIEIIRNICRALPSATEGIKWGNDLCFMIGDKMFCVITLESPSRVSLKVKDEEFEELTNLNGIVPAPYVARHKWILVEQISIFSKKEWEFYIHQSYLLVRSKLPKKKMAQLKNLK